MELEHSLYDGHSVALGHPQVEHHDIGAVLLVESDGIFTVDGLCDDFHVRLLIDHGREAVAYHRMIVREDHPDFLSQNRNHHALRLGSLTRTRVPDPG